MKDFIDFVQFFWSSTKLIKDTNENRAYKNYLKLNFVIGINGM